MRKKLKIEEPPDEDKSVGREEAVKKIAKKLTDLASGAEPKVDEQHAG